MSKITPYDIEFFELTNLLKREELNKPAILSILLKLNNPTYYSKYIFKNPIERHGYTSNIIKYPILKAVNNMLIALKNTKNIDALKKQLQVEMAWAFNNFNGYNNVDL
jgi:hypothetical protein